MNNWKEVTLGSVCDFGDGAHTKVKRLEYGVKYLTSKNIKNGALNLEKIDFISEDDYARLFGQSNNSIRNLQSGDILLSIIGSLGNVYVYKPTDRFGISSSIAILRPNTNVALSEYLYSFLSSSYFSKLLLSVRGGSVQGYTNLPLLRSLSIILPPLPEQKAIADTLSCLDDKIELNNKINKNLEEMAQAIFKSWFVDFEPFKDGEFVDSELGEIPKDWRVIPLYDFANYINGSSFKKDEYVSTGIPIIKITELKNGITNATEYFDGIKPEKFYIKDKDILFSWSGNPDTSIDIFIWNGGVSILNQHTFKVESHNNTQGFIFLLLKYFKSEFAEIARNKQTTGLGHVTVADLKRLQFVINEHTIAEFENIIKPTMNQIFVNMKQNQKLAQIRDSLLPKLMSGEVRVPVEIK